MRNIFESTRAFEAWMRKRTDVSGRLLKKKHRKMGAGPFPFLRATFYRWVEQWPEVCPRLAERDRGRAACRRRSARGELRRLAGFATTAGLGRSTTSTTPASCPLRAISCGWPPVSSWRRRRRTWTRRRIGCARCCSRDTGPDSVAEGQPILLADGRHPALVKLTTGHAGRPEDVLERRSSTRTTTRRSTRRELPTGLEDMFRASFRPGADLTFREQRSPGGLGSLGRRRFTAVESAEGRARRTRGQGARALRTVLVGGAGPHAARRRRHCSSTRSVFPIRISRCTTTG